MSLIETVQKDLVKAMKARDEERLSAIRLIKAALKKHEVDSMKPLDEAAELQILNSLVKQRTEAAAMFRKGGREELARRELAELEVIESYMPAPATPEAMETAIAVAMAKTGVSSLKQMGVVVKAARASLTGQRVDGKVLSDMVRAKLS